MASAAGLDKVVEKTLGTIVDPFMWFCILIIGGLIFIIWFILSSVVGKSMREIFDGQKQANDNIAEYNKTLASVLEMVRVAVLGVKGKGI